MKSVSYGKDRHDTLGVIHATDLTNETAVSAYLNALRARKMSDNHITHLRQTLNRVADYIAPTSLVAADFTQLLNWQTSITRLSAGSIAVYISNVRSFYAWLVRPMRILDISPAGELMPPRVPDRKPRPVPETDYQWAVNNCADDLITTWLYLERYAGLRCCEVATLHRDDVRDDKDAHRLHIVGKGQKERFIPISVELRQELQPWMHHGRYLFLRDNGRRFEPAHVSWRINEHFRSLGMPYTAHQLRHLYGTDALERSKDIRLVQESMGHSSVATTQRYTQVNSANGLALAVELGEDLRKHRRR